MKQQRAVPQAGASAGSRKVLVEDLMTGSVLTTTRHQSVRQVRATMSERSIHSLPVVDQEGQAIGIVTSTDLLDGVSDDTLIGQVMIERVYVVPRYAAVHEAARIMRNHRIHHVIVTDEKRVVGLVSSFDLLRLVEDKRFVPRSGPVRSRKGGKRQRVEGA